MKETICKFQDEVFILIFGQIEAHIILKGPKHNVNKSLKNPNYHDIHDQNRMQQQQLHRKGNIIEGINS